MGCGSADPGRVMDDDTCALDCHASNTGKERCSRAVTCHGLPEGPGRFQLLRPWLLSSVCLAVFATTAAVDAGLSPALAQCAGPPDNTICTSGGNPYATGINVFNTNPPISLTLRPGVEVIIPTGSPGINAVNAANTTGPTAASADITITADGVTIRGCPGFC